MPSVTTGGQSIVIIVMGSSAADKSSFIKNVLTHLKSDPNIFNHRMSEVVEYPPANILTGNGDPVEGKGKLVLVDLPAFDDAKCSDTKSLRLIANWLGSAYTRKMEIAGIVYIDPIYQNRPTTIEEANIKILQKICGQGGLSKVLFATTRVETFLSERGKIREDDIQKRFNPIDESKVVRLENSPSSAWAVAETILKTLDGGGATVLALQKQLVQKGKIFQQTGAAQQLRAKILGLLEDEDFKTAPGWKSRAAVLEREAKLLQIPLSKRLPSLNPLRFRRQLQPSQQWRDMVEFEYNVHSDIVIPVMGPTGAGKSTFINSLLQFPQAAISDGYASCTTKLTPYAVGLPPDLAFKHSLENRRLVLVDTPGFDNTDLEDEEVLRRIAVWLACSYGSDAQMKVGGAVYLFPFTTRVTNSDRSKTEVFRKLCGDNYLSRMVLATTQGNLYPGDTIDGREKELRETLFESSNNAGALSTRFDGTRDSALAIINHILGRLKTIENAGKEVRKSGTTGETVKVDVGPEPAQCAEANGDPLDAKTNPVLLEGSECIVLKIQAEMTIEGKKWTETEAARVLRAGRAARPELLQTLKRLYQPMLKFPYTKGVPVRGPKPSSSTESICPV